MDDRPLKLIQRAPDEHRPALEALASEAARLADASGADLQFEFGKEHIGFIVGCNQFLRLWFRGDDAGQVELPPESKLEGAPALGLVFRMFQWQSAPATADLVPLVQPAFESARSKGQPKL